MEKIKIVGGGLYGMFSLTWPFVTLKVGKDQLEFIMNFFIKIKFSKEDIISIEPYTGMMSKGLKINHQVNKYSKSIIFWTWKDPNEVIQDIYKIGFLQ